MWDAAELIDADRLVKYLLDRDAPEHPRTGAPSLVLGDLDVDTIDDVPVTTYRLVLGGQAQDSNGIGLWTATLFIRAYVESGTGFDFAKHWYRKVHAWDMPGNGTLVGVGGVETVTDTEVFARISPAVQMIGKHVDQYLGAFGLTLRSL